MNFAVYQQRHPVQPQGADEWLANVVKVGEVEAQTPGQALAAAALLPAFNTGYGRFGLAHQPIVHNPMVEAAARRADEVAAIDG